MEKILNEGLLRRKIVYMVLICRMLMWFVLVVLYICNQLRPVQLLQLLFITLPIGVMYFVFLLKYVLIHKRYFAASANLPGRDYQSAYLLIITIYLLEIFSIYLRDIIFSGDFVVLCGAISVMESALGAYAGFYLSGLFAINNEEPGKQK